MATLRTYQAPVPDPVMVARALIVRQLAARLELALNQVADTGRAIEAQVRPWGGPLTQLCGVAELTAGMLAAHLAGRTFTTDAQLASHAGVAPLDASSGAQVRHRLNRGGNRQLNAILHRIALTQSRCHPPAQAYLARKRADGKTREEAVRCLKRYIARAVFRAWKQCVVPPLAAPLT